MNLNLIIKEFTEFLEIKYSGKEIEPPGFDILVTKKKKTKTKKKARAAAREEHLNFILSEIRKNEPDMVKRSKLCFTICFLYVTGVRISNIKNITYGILNKIVNGEDFELELIKTGKRKVIMDFPHNNNIAHIYSLAKAEFDFLIKNQEKLESKGKYVVSYSREHLTREINKYMKKASEHFEVELKSHSFRINMANELIKIADINVARELLGHANVATTQKYVRGSLEKENKIKIYNQLVKENKNSKETKEGK